jgi:hypothetical protein
LSYWIDLTGGGAGKKSEQKRAGANAYNMSQRGPAGNKLIVNVHPNGHHVKLINPNTLKDLNSLFV